MSKGPSIKSVNYSGSFSIFSTALQHYIFLALNKQCSTDRNLSRVWLPDRVQIGKNTGKIFNTVSVVLFYFFLPFLGVSITGFFSKLESTSSKLLSPGSLLICGSKLATSTSTPDKILLSHASSSWSININ